MESFERLKDTKEIKDFIESYRKLQVQISNPTREGMIEALSNAQNVAHQEITIIEKQQGDIYPMLWSNFPNDDLYRKLTQYQQGLFYHAVNKFGEEIVKKILKESLQNQ